MANKKQADVKSKKTTKKNVSTKNTKKETAAIKEVKTSKKETAPKKEIKTSKKEVEVVEEPMADIMEEPKHKISVSRDTLKLIGNIIFWTIILVLAVVWIVDFVKVTSEKEPIFCIKNEVHEYDDGTVKECTGLGYKVYTYNRNSLGTGVEFEPFFVKMKQPEK